MANDEFLSNAWRGLGEGWSGEPHLAPPSRRLQRRPVRPPRTRNAWRGHISVKHSSSAFGEVNCLLSGTQAT